MAYWTDNNAGKGWDEFLIAVKQRFEPDLYDEYVGRLAALRQTSSVEAYQTAFESPLQTASWDGVPNDSVAHTIMNAQKVIVEDSSILEAATDSGGIKDVLSDASLDSHDTNADAINTEQVIGKEVIIGPELFEEDKDSDMTPTHPAPTPEPPAAELQAEVAPAVAPQTQVTPQAQPELDTDKTASQARPKRAISKPARYNTNLFSHQPPTMRHRLTAMAGDGRSIPPRDDATNRQQVAMDMQLTPFVGGEKVSASKIQVNPISHTPQNALSTRSWRPPPSHTEAAATLPSESSRNASVFALTRAQHALLLVSFCGDGEWSRAIHQLGADNGVHIFDPGAFEQDDSCAGENPAIVFLMDGLYAKGSLSAALAMQAEVAKFGIYRDAVTCDILIKGHYKTDSILQVEGEQSRVHNHFSNPASLLDIYTSGASMIFIEKITFVDFSSTITCVRFEKLTMDQLGKCLLLLKLTHICHLEDEPLLFFFHFPP